MVIITFSILNKDSRKRFFEESFLLADINPDVLLEILFLAMSNVDINFQA